MSRSTDALRAFVARSDDARLERTLGSAPGLRLLFGAMARRFDPEAAAGFEGEIAYELRDARGRERAWTVVVAEGRARARPGPSGVAALTVRMGTSDLVRLAAGELDAGSALLSGRLDLEGDTAVAMRLGDMFGTDAGLGPR